MIVWRGLEKEQVKKLTIPQIIIVHQTHHRCKCDRKPRYR